MKEVKVTKGVPITVTLNCPCCATNPPRIESCEECEVKCEGSKSCKVRIEKLQEDERDPLINGP